MGPTNGLHSPAPLATALLATVAPVVYGAVPEPLAEYVPRWYRERS